jgi:SAM-dependent methyltransferase
VSVSGSPTHPSDSLDLEVTWRAERYQRWIIDAFRCELTGRVLEVGAGVGAMTWWLAETARHVTALEPDDARRASIGALRLANVSTQAGRVEELVPGPSSFDVAVLVNVLEHLHDDTEAIVAVRQVLVPGGRVCILVPAHAGLFGSLDETYGHLRRYDRARVGRLLDRAGFATERLRYFNPIGAVGWFAMGRVLRRRALSPASVALAERLIVPASRALERFGDPPFGQSVLAVGRRDP